VKAVIQWMPADICAENVPTQGSACHLDGCENVRAGSLGNMGLGVDVLVRSEAEYRRRSQVPGTVYSTGRVSKGRRCMQPYLEEAWRSLRLADRDIRTSGT